MLRNISHYIKEQGILSELPRSSGLIKITAHKDRDQAVCVCVCRVCG